MSVDKEENVKQQDNFGGDTDVVVQCKGCLAKLDEKMFVNV